MNSCKLKSGDIILWVGTYGEILLNEIYTIDFIRQKKNEVIIRFMDDRWEYIYDSKKMIKLNNIMQKFLGY